MKCDKTSSWVTDGPRCSLTLSLPASIFIKVLLPDAASPEIQNAVSSGDRSQVINRVLAFLARASDALRACLKEWG